jgi:hypothetical protein
MANPDNFVFPAADSLASWQTQTMPDTKGIESTIYTNANNDIETSILTAETNSRSALSYGMYLSRNKTISGIVDDMMKQNSKYDNGESDTYTRQSEINEWQAQNKLDTFFFLQCMFIYLMIVILLIFLRRLEAIPSSAFYGIVTILTLILLGILYNRAAYTYFQRDKRYWNRRYISLADAGVFEKPPGCPTPESSINIGAALYNGFASFTSPSQNSSGDGNKVGLVDNTGQMKDLSGNVMPGAPV